MIFRKPDFSLNKKNLFKLAMIAVLFGYSALVFSAAPSGGYDPFETLDPDCLPGETDCIANVSSGSAYWTQTGDDIYFSGGNIGIGTTTPEVMIDIRSSINLDQSASSDVVVLNDLNIIDNGYSGLLSNTFTVTIDSSGTPDTFSWSDANDSCAGASNVAITGSEQVLCDGISIDFGATTGHSLGSSWDIEVTITTPGGMTSTGQLFSGSGPDNGLFSGMYTGVIEPYTEFYVYIDSYVSNGIAVFIDSEGTPDTFGWYDYNGECGAGGIGIPITVGSPQELCNGISITFSADTGHLNGDQWDYYFDSGLVPYESQWYSNPVSNQDDAVFSGTMEYTETFAWADAYGECAGGFGLTIVANVPTELCEGISFTFTDDSLHVSNDTWTSGYFFTPAEYSKVKTANIITRDDAVFSGTFTGFIDATYTVTISDTGSPDTFDWTATGCAGATNVAITGSAQTLCNGLSVTFDNLTGHVAGNEWVYDIVAEKKNTFSVLNSLLFNINNIGDITKIRTITYSWPGSQGDANMALINDGSGNLSWGVPGPSQTGNAGEFLTTNGTTLSWGTGSMPNWMVINDTAEPSIFLGDNVYNHDAFNHQNKTGGVVIGERAGYASYSNNVTFVGYNAGYNNSTYSLSSTFIGYNAGAGVINSASAVMLGMGAGTSGSAPSNQLAHSVFIGQATGDAPSGGTGKAQNSIFIGYQAGLNDTADNSGGTTSILIGHLANTGGFERSIALGTSATNTASNQFMIGSTTSPIDTTRINGSASTQCTITTGTGIACSSDERLKTNITDLDTDTLTKLLNVRTVTYNWVQDPDTPTQIGFIAQDLEQQFPELVITDDTGYKSVYYAQMTPILVESIREMNLKITALESLTPETSPLFATLRTWLADAGNGIVEVVVKITRSKELHTNESYTDQLCIGTTCVDEQQLQQIVQG